MERKPNRPFEIANEILYVFNEYIEEDEDDNLSCDIILSLSVAFCEFTIKHTNTNTNREEVLNQFVDSIKGYPDFFIHEEK